jgi:hypothetical protein
VGVSVDWSGVTGAPATYPPAAHGHVGSDITSAVANATNASNAATAAAVPWLGVTGVPGTFPPEAHTHTGAQITSAVANATNATTAATATSVAWAGVTGAPATFPPATHTHTGAQITSAVANATTAATATSVAWSGVTGAPTSFPPGAHTHAGTDITSTVANATNASAVPWTGVTSKPATFPPSAHTHAGTEITSTVANATNAVSATTATTASSVPWTGITGAPTTFPPSAGSTSYIQNQTAANQVANIQISGTIDAVGQIHGGGTSGAAFRVGNDVDLVDINLPSAMRIQGVFDATEGNVYLGTGGVLSAQGDSWLSKQLIVGITPSTASDFALYVGNTAQGQKLARFGSGANPLFINSPDAAVGWNAYFDAGWRYGTAISGYAGFTAMAFNNSSPRIVTGMSAAAGVNPNIATIQQTLNVFSNNTIGVGVNIMDANKVINTNASGAYLALNGTWQTASSRAFKKDIVTLDDALSLLDEVRVVTYRYRPDHGDDGRRHVGVIAEEVPDLLATAARSSVAANELAALSLGANKALRKKVQLLEAENLRQQQLLRALELRLEKLEKRPAH